MMVGCSFTTLPNFYQNPLPVMLDFCWKLWPPGCGDEAEWQTLLLLNPVTEWSIFIVGLATADALCFFLGYWYNYRRNNNT